jgi:mannose-6-phosphate isomerase-like protein (cupin superfamily)
MDEAAWQPLIPGTAKGPEFAAVHAEDAMSQTLLRVPKESTLPAGHHQADGTLVLLEGELTIETGGKTFSLKRGSVLELPEGTVYGGRTKWDRPALALITLTGPWSRSPA